MNVVVIRDCRCPVCGHIAGQEDKNAYAMEGWKFVASMVEAMLMEKQAERERLAARYGWRPPPGPGAA